jgi:hypothetical protein
LLIGQWQTSPQALPEASYTRDENIAALKVENPLNGIATDDDQMVDLFILSR